MASAGDPFLFGIPEGGVEAFLGELGYGTIRNVTDREYLRGLFPPDEPVRKATGLLGFCRARL